MIGLPGTVTVGVPQLLMAAALLVQAVAGSVGKGLSRAQAAACAAVYAALLLWSGWWI